MGVVFSTAPILLPRNNKRKGSILVATWLLPISLALCSLHQQSFVTPDGSLRPKTTSLGSHPGSQRRSLGKFASETQVIAMVEGGLPAPTSHLGDKADLTPSPLKGQAATGAA